tara:strand:+ start:1572 stop:2543 length:972 start_codon:yes stop_codon:yes gene_type:complete
MADQVTEQTVRQAPFIEQRSEQLLASVFGDPNAVQEANETTEAFNLRRYGRAGIGRDVPEYEVSGFSPDQLNAMKMARSGVGGFAPFMNMGRDTLAEGVRTTGLGTPLIQRGSEALTSSDINQYLNPYQQFVTDEIVKQGDIAKNKMAGAATRGGVFGGSRYGIAEGQLDADVAAKVGQSNAQGYAQALQAAEAAKKRSLYGGQGLGSLGTQIGQLGGAQAGMGLDFQRAGLTDVNSLLGIGGLNQQLAQSGIDAARKTEEQRQLEPFTRLGYASDILSGQPSSYSTYTNTYGTGAGQDVSPWSQVAGLGLAGLGAYNKGLFG